MLYETSDCPMRSFSILPIGRAFCPLDEAWTVGWIWVFWRIHSKSFFQKSSQNSFLTQITSVEPHDASDARSCGIWAQVSVLIKTTQLSLSVLHAASTKFCPLHGHFSHFPPNLFHLCSAGCPTCRELGEKTSTLGIVGLSHVSFFGSQLISFSNFPGIITPLANLGCKSA